MRWTWLFLIVANCDRSPTVTIAPSASTITPASATATATATPSASASAVLDKVEDLLAKFVAPGADLAGLSKALRPTPADYQTLFDPATAAKLQSAYDAEWEKGSILITPKVGQTKFTVSAASVADLNGGSSSAGGFPGGYRRIAPHMLLGHTWYLVSFVNPGEAAGTSFDGLTFVNGHWVIVPKPWRGL